MPQKIEVSATAVEKPKLVLPQADELNLRDVKWMIITEDNYDKQMEKLKASGRSVAFFAVTDEGYTNLGLNISDLRAYLQQQQAIIGAYEGYYQDAETALDDANKEINDAKTSVEDQQNVPEKSLWEKITN